MPYFSNRTDDETVDSAAREGGERLAKALAQLYEMVGHLERDDMDSGMMSLGACRDALKDSALVLSAAESRAVIMCTSTTQPRRSKRRWKTT